MTKIADLIRRGPTLSFEFFPPKTPGGIASLNRTIDTLSALQPDFVSVTYGAGGSDRDRTRDLVIELNRDRPFPAMAHLTCVGHTTNELETLVDEYRDNGVHNLLALAGDPPEDGSDPGGDFRYASELVELIRSRGDFAVAVAAFPETHPRSTDRDEDRRHLAAKLAAADFGVTQFFFRGEDYERMVDELAAIGCDVPILPGIMPVTNPRSVARFAKMSNASMPSPMWDRLWELDGQPEALLDAAVEFAAELIEDLGRRGAPGYHLYALNRPEASLAIAKRVGWLSPDGTRVGGPAAGVDASPDSDRTSRTAP